MSVGDIVEYVSIRSYIYKEIYEQVLVIQLKL